MPPSQTPPQSFQLLCGLTYLGLLYGLAQHLGHGPKGVIAANIISMTLRFLYCFRFALRYFRHRDAAGVSTNPQALTKPRP